MALVEIANYTDPLDANILKARLDAEGISAYIANENHIQMNWLYSQALGGARVMVQAEDAEQAAELVEQLNNGDLAIADDDSDAYPACPRCGGLAFSYPQTTRRIAFASLFFLNIPLPFKRRERPVCDNCGYRLDS